MEKVIIFGIGKRLEKLINGGYLNGMEILAFSDNDKIKQGLCINGVEVISPDEIERYEYDSIYISSLQYFHEIKRQLTQEYGILSEKMKAFDIPDEKYSSEISYWEDVFLREGGKFRNSHYKELMLAIAEEQDDEFLTGKVVADFGCGPRGSLAWTDKPLVKLGIDVLSARYLEKFGEELIRHNMIYVTSSEGNIPVPSSYVDYLYTINSLDHVDNLEQMINELVRIIKPQGVMLASFNLNEPCTECEPQTLTEDIIKTLFSRNFEVLSYRLAYKDETDTYANFKNNNLVSSLKENRPAILWMKGRKKHI